MAKKECSKVKDHDVMEFQFCPECGLQLHDPDEDRIVQLAARGAEQALRKAGLIKDDPPPPPKGDDDAQPPSIADQFKLGGKKGKK